MEISRFYIIFTLFSLLLFIHYETLLISNKFTIQTRLFPQNSYQFSEISKKNIDKQVRIAGIKNGLVPKYIYKLISYDLTFDQLRKGKLYGFIKNSDKIPYDEYLHAPNLLPKFTEKSYFESYNGIKAKIAIYNDAYATCTGEFVINNHIIRPPTDSAPNNVRVYSEGPVVLECDKACIFGHGNAVNFGHFINDYLSPMMLLPQEYLEDCIVILAEGTRRFYDFLKICGVRRFIFISSGEWVHTNQLAVAVEGRPHFAHFGIPIQMLHDRITEFYNLSHIIPTRNVLLNRQRGVQRSILNFDEIVNRVKTDIPNFNFECVEDKTDTLQSYAKFFSTIQFLFTHSGSNCNKALFMRKDTVTVICGSDFFDVGSLSMILSIGINCVVYHNTYNHFIGKVYPDVDLTIDAIKAGVCFIENHHWPKITSNVTFIDYIKK